MSTVRLQVNNIYSINQVIIASFWTSAPHNFLALKIFLSEYTAVNPQISFRSSDIKFQLFKIFSLVACLDDVMTSVIRESWTSIDSRLRACRPGATIDRLPAPCKLYISCCLGGGRDTDSDSSPHTRLDSVPRSRSTHTARPSVRFDVRRSSHITSCSGAWAPQPEAVRARTVYPVRGRSEARTITKRLRDNMTQPNSLNN